MHPDLIRELKDPLKFAKFFWPKVDFYEKQREIIYSVEQNDETYVPAGNMLGKDFVTGFIVLRAFLIHPVARIITTSIKDDHLRVLWGEIQRFIQTSKYPLTADRGGVLVLRHRDIRKTRGGVLCDLSYMLGCVSEKGEGMSGHHAPYTLMVGDEASGIDEQVRDNAQGWAKKFLWIGNPNPCNNFFFKGVEAGDQEAENGTFHRKVIRVCAEDSPNVKRALYMQSIGMEPDNETILPGVLKWEDGIKGYVYRRKHWDTVRQCIGLDGVFYKGAEVLLYPPEWLNRAERIAERLRGQKRSAMAIGCDPGEGGDDTAWSVVDGLGLIYQEAMKTPDTSIITGRTLALMRQYNVPPYKVCFDRGGGGHEHADRLRAQGHNVRTVAFGETLALEPKRGMRFFSERVENREERYTYKNRRAEMYHSLSLLLDPNNVGFGLPKEYTELRRQLSPMQKLTDEEGRYWMLPKNKKNKDDKRPTLTEQIGCSPDEADSLVLAIHAMTTKTSGMRVQSMV